ncbi:MAG: response regulator transcription factor [Azonexus sp.]|nr:response regulator transcription factor [Azonexus sp.]MCK6411172.1 response regulator transcription factor [Azonexus sp.]
MLKLLVVEDHALVREGLVRLLAQVDEEVELAEAADFEMALTLLDDNGEYDLVFLDLALPGIDGFSGLDVLRRRYPAMPVVVVSAYDDTPTVNRVLSLGASGFIPKACSGEALLAAARSVLDGNIFRPSGQPSNRITDENELRETNRFPISVKPCEIGLTERQAQVLGLMVRGFSNRDIAEQLSLSEGTVKIHASAIFRTLDVSSRTQALVAVARYGIDFEDIF